MQSTAKVNLVSKQSDICDVVSIDPHRVKVVQAKMPEASIFHDLAQTFKALADPSRVKIIHALMITELCVCDVAQVVGLTLSATSHQLGLLRTMRLVKSRREGKQVYYSLDDDHIEHLFHEGLEHIKE